MLLEKGIQNKRQKIKNKFDINFSKNCLKK